jgi:hypothetical protein
VRRPTMSGFPGMKCPALRRDVGLFDPGIMDNAFT